MPNEYGIDDSVKDSLDRYVKDYVPTGGFLQAVLENDLMESFGRADSVNQQNMLNILKYLYNHVPMGCRGSKEKVKAWLAKRG